ncbi:MAG TPA: VWA domain-containing protein [Kofleriaceae bacterium]|nr:VWA domain-containing protein [Kofleriaceae bacterium]
MRPGGPPREPSEPRRGGGRRREQLTIAWTMLFIVAGITALAMWGDLDKQRAGEELEWQNPWALLLLLACPLVAWVQFHLRRRRSATFFFSRVHDLGLVRPGWMSRLVALPAVCRITAIGLIAVALARPQTYREEERTIEGIDIMIVLDLSKSMQETDLRLNRLDAGQRVIRGFVSRRDSDRLGLVVFAREALLQSPLTTDYRSLDQVVADLAIGDVPELGTAIGDALGLALAQLRRSEARSKIVILVSDGDSNVAYKMDPDEATKLASQMGIRVFTVLVGREEGGSPFGSTQYAVNPELLKGMARDTGGQFFHAGDDAALEASFEAIRATLEKSEIKVVGRTPDKELFHRFLVPAVIFLLLELVMSLTRWRRFP